MIENIFSTLKNLFIHFFSVSYVIFPILLLHTSIMIERVLVKEESGKIDSIDTEGINEESRKFIEVSKDIFKSIMMKYKIEISDAEYLLLYQILQSVIQK